MRDEIFKSAKEKYELAIDISKRNLIISEPYFLQTQPLFLECVIKGKREALRYLGSVRYGMNEHIILRSAISYLKAAIVVLNDPSAWLNLADLHAGSRRHRNHSLATYEFLQAWYATTDCSLREEIKHAAENLGRTIPGDTIIKNENRVDWLLAILPDFWIAYYYHYYFCKQSTSIPDKIKERFLEKLSFLDGFIKKSKSWKGLVQHFKWSTKPLHLFYVKNKLNEEKILELIAAAIQSCGYTVTMCEWNNFREEIPEDAVVAVLSDISLFAESYERQQNQKVDRDEDSTSSFFDLQHHTGSKLWIPWQLPDEFGSESGEMFEQYFSTEWKSWTIIHDSLSDNPTELFFGKNGLMSYLIPESKKKPFAKLLTYLRERTVFNKSIGALYPANKRSELIEILSVLSSDSEDLSMVQQNYYSLYEYLALDDTGKSVLDAPASALTHSASGLFHHNTPPQAISTTSSAPSVLDHTVVTMHQLAVTYGIKDILSFSEAFKGLPSDAAMERSIFSDFVRYIIDVLSRPSSVLNPDFISEARYLAYSQDPKTLKALFFAYRSFLSCALLPSDSVSIEIMRSLIFLLSLDALLLSSNELINSLDLLMNFINKLHIQANEEEVVYHTLCVVGFIAMKMKVIETKNIDRMVREEYLNQMRQLNSYASPRVANMGAWVLGGIRNVATSETPFGTAVRIGNDAIVFASGVQCMMHKLPKPPGFADSGIALLKCLRDGLNHAVHASGIVASNIELHEQLTELNKHLSVVMKTDTANGIFDQTRKFLKNLFINQQETVFIFGVMQLLEFVIRNHKVTEVKIDAIVLLKNVFEWVDSLSRANDEKIYCCLIPTFRTKAAKKVILANQPQDRLDFSQLPSCFIIANAA